MSTQERAHQEIRARLHLVTGRREDRLVFDVQDARRRDELGPCELPNCRRERSADAAVLPRSQGRHADQHHPAAEHRAPPVPGREQSRTRRSTRRFVVAQRTARIWHTSRGFERRPERRSCARSCCMRSIRELKGMSRAADARALARAGQGRRALPARPRQPRDVHRDAAAAAAAYCTSCAA